MSDIPLGFGLLGAGLIAPFHARALQASGKARLAAASDIDAARLARFCEDFGCRGYATLAEMLDDPEIDVVSILTPNHLHRAALLECGRAREARAGGEAAGHVVGRGG